VPLDVHVTVAAVPAQPGRPAANGGGPSGLRWLLRDVTAAKQAERLAAVGQMAAGLAHESRNALQRGQACLEMLEIQVQDRPRALELARRVRKAQDDLHRLFESVRSYAAPITLRRQVHDLGQILRDAWENLGWQRRGRQAALEETSRVPDLRCAVDLPALERVFVNVLGNALDVCNDPVAVRVTWLPAAIRRREAVQACVQDNGPGLLPEQRLRLFEPFYTTKTQGTGLGMALARRIVQAHGGRIDAGDAEGPGAEILITLPRGIP
jgi:signal transduction histidine kinase